MILTTLQDTVFENIENSNGLFTKHFHDTYTIGITHSGLFKSIKSNQSSFSYKNSVRVINPGEIHHGDSNSWKYTNVYPRIELFAEIYHQMYFERKIPVFEKHIIEDIKLYKLLYKFFYSVFHKDDEMSIETNLIEAFSYLIKNHTSTTKENKILYDEKNIIKTSIEYINDYIDKSILLDDLAEEFSMSKYHYLRVFKKNLGLTPHNYILTQRVHRAKENILKGKSLSETTFDVGFSDQSHFTRSFRRIYGYSPKELLNKSNFILYK